MSDRDDLCQCGHPRSEHYRYIRNGEDAGRCRACDPTSHLPPGSYALALEQGTYTRAMYYAADHDFKPIEDRVA